jgi:hypothetical protein
MTGLSRGKPVFTSALDTPECDPKACASAVLRLIKLLCGYRGKEVGFMREPGSPGKGRPICHVSISSWGPESSRRSWQCLRRDAAQLFGTIERNALARLMFHWRPRGMVLHRHLRAAVAGRGLRGIPARRRQQTRGRHRLNGGPDEEGKAGQDKEQSPEDHDPHSLNIRRTLTVFKVPSAAARLSLLVRHVAAP